MLPAQVREKLAADLAEAERTRQPSPLTDAHPDIDVVDAYEIQLINIRSKVADGARVIGHKVGLSSEAMQKMMNVDEPDYGHLLDGMEGAARHIGQRASLYIVAKSPIARLAAFAAYRTTEGVEFLAELSVVRPQRLDDIPDRFERR